MDEDDRLELLETARKRCVSLVQELHRVVVGQDDVIVHLVTALFARGHCLLIGVPGLAKTLLVKTLAQCLEWDYKRIQCTPDLMPSDIIGGEVLDVDPDTGQRCLRFVDGPIFTNILLVDEINRTLPRTQSALLEAMQECAVTVGGRTKPIAPPFFVVATQNPIEQEGTYPLPEAQLDRFMYTLPVNYPSVEQEEEIATATTSDTVYTPRAICSRAELLQFQDLIRQIPVSPHVVKFAVSLARASRPDSPKPHPLIRRYAQWGAGPRASQYMILGAKALAVMQGKPTPTANDVRRIAPLVLQHRIVVNYAAVADDVTSADLAKAVLDGVPEPAYAKRL